MQFLDLLDVGWVVHLQYGTAFVKVHFNPPVSDHEAGELASAYPESTFFRVEAHVIFAEFPLPLVCRYWTKGMHLWGMPYLDQYSWCTFTIFHWHF